MWLPFRLATPCIVRTKIEMRGINHAEFLAFLHALGAAHKPFNASGELALQMRIKTVFDPQWLLNPHKVFPLAGREIEHQAWEH